MAQFAEKSQKTEEAPEAKSDPIPLYRDALPRESSMTKEALIALPKLPKNHPPYRTDSQTHLITNAVELELVGKDDPDIPNLAVLDSALPASEQTRVTIGGLEYERFSSHLRMVLDVVPSSVDVQLVYDISRGDAAFSLKGVTAALAHLVETAEAKEIKYVNCSFSTKITYSQAEQMLATHLGAEPGTDGATRNPIRLTPENLREHRVKLAEAIRKEYDSGSADSDSREVLKQVALYEKLISMGILVVASAGNDGRNSFDPVQVLVPEIVVVTGLNGSTIDAQATDHSLVDTAQSFRGYGSQEEQRSGTSFAAPSALTLIRKFEELGYTVTQMNEVLSADHEVRVRGNENAISIPSSRMFVPTFLDSVTKEPERAFEPEKLALIRDGVTAMSKLYFGNERRVFSVMHDHPDVTAQQAIRLLNALDQSFKEKLISVDQFRQVYQAYAAIPSENRSAAATRLAAKPGSVTADMLKTADAVQSIFNP